MASAAGPGPGQPAGSHASYRGPPAVALPRHLNSPERWFLLAAVLKLMIFMQGSSPYTWLFASYGFVIPTGPVAAILMFAFGLVLLALAHWILDTELLQRRFVVPLIILGCFAALAVSRIHLGREMSLVRAEMEKAEIAEMKVMEKERPVAERATAQRAKPLQTAEDSDRVWAEIEKRQMQEETP